MIHIRINLHEFAQCLRLFAILKLKSPDTSERVTGEYIFEQAEQNKEVQQLIVDWVDTLWAGINIAVTLNPQKY